MTIKKEKTIAIKMFRSHGIPFVVAAKAAKLYVKGLDYFAEYLYREGYMTYESELVYNELDEETQCIRRYWYPDGTLYSSQY